MVFTQPLTHWHRFMPFHLELLVKNTMLLRLEVQRVLQRYRELQDIIAILGMDELSDEENIGWTCSSYPILSLSQTLTLLNSLQVNPGSYVPVAETVRSFKEILKVNMIIFQKMPSVA